MYASQHSLPDQLRRFFFSKSAVSRLILINSAVWIVIYITRIPLFLVQRPGEMMESSWLEQVVRFLSVPAAVGDVYGKPWTVLTYMFFHVQFWHLFFNMMALYVFGKIFLEFLDGRKMWQVYILGGVAGAIVYISAFNIFPVFADELPVSVAFGASASVLAVMAATAILVPEYSISLLFIGNVKLKHIALIFIAIDILMIRSGNAGGHFAHLGGVFAGLLYILAYRGGQKGRMPRLHAFLRKAGNIRFPLRKRKLKTVHSRPVTDEEYNARRALNQEKIDVILDKIARSGYQSLSAEEKEFLFKTSNKG